VEWIVRSAIFSSVGTGMAVLTNYKPAMAVPYH